MLNWSVNNIPGLYVEKVSRFYVFYGQVEL